MRVWREDGPVWDAASIPTLPPLYTWHLTVQKSEKAINWHVDEIRRRHDIHKRNRKTRWLKIKSLRFLSVCLCFGFFFLLKTNKPSWLVSQCTARLRPGLWRTSERTCLARTCPALSLLWLTNHENVNCPDRKRVKWIKLSLFLFSRAAYSVSPQNLGAARTSMSLCLAVIGGKFVTKGNMFFNQAELPRCSVTSGQRCIMIGGKFVTSPAAALFHPPSMFCGSSLKCCFRVNSDIYFFTSTRVVCYILQKHGLDWLKTIF